MSGIEGIMADLSLLYSWKTAPSILALMFLAPGGVQCTLIMDE